MTDALFPRGLQQTDVDTSNAEVTSRLRRYYKRPEIAFPPVLTEQKTAENMKNGSRFRQKFCRKPWSRIIMMMSLSPRIRPFGSFFKNSET